MNRDAIAGRKLEVMNAAANRWQANALAIARTAERLARGGPQEAASTNHIDLFLSRESLKRALEYRRGIGLERIIGGVDFEDLPPNEAARKAGRPVARIVEFLTNNRVGDGVATGFIVAPGLLLTNWHVFAEVEDAKECGVQFGFERGDSGLVEPGTIFALDPSLFFHSDKALDIALVGIVPGARLGQPVALSTYGRVKLIPALGKILVGHPVSIIQHPAGRHKHWAVRQNKLLLEPKEADLFLTYATDTLEGSSGSPAFNFDWELVAVHHSGVPRRVDGHIVTTRGEPWRPGMPESEIDWIANEGARVSKICHHLRQVRLSSEAQQTLLATLLADVGDLPMRSEAVIPTGDADLRPPQLGKATMNIVINGTANFYLGNQDDRTWTLEKPTGPIPGPIPAGPLPMLAEKKLKFDSDYANRPGYDHEFLTGFEVPVPTAPLGEVLKAAGKALILDYHHYSLVMHEVRRLAMWTASNVDYNDSKRWRSREEFGTDTWKPDPRIPVAAQIEDLEFYEPAAKFDRGHLVRRDDVAWGDTKQVEEYGNSDSFHWTNCTPQHEGFNRDMFGYQGLWGQLEHHITEQAKFVGKRLIVLAGPVLDPADPKKDFGSGIAVQVPIKFWKVVVAAEQVGPGAAKTVRAYGFVLDQMDAIDQYGWEGRFKAGKFKEQQVSLSEITNLCRVEFDQAVHNADPLASAPLESRRRSLRTLDDVKLR